MLRRPLPSHPRRIILIKSHSAGIGDILRSSAAWAVLKRRWPDAELHLIFLTRWPGYPSEELISRHHLLHSAHFLPLQEGRFAGMRGVGPKGWRSLLPELRRLGKEIQPDLIIDHEPHGIETAIASRILRAQSPRAATVGVAQVPGRGLLYDHSGPSLSRYAQKHGLPQPMDYTERDFAALAALGLERKGQPICLQVGTDGRAWQQKNCKSSERLRIGLNIGCGTPDALAKRPDLDLLVESFGKLALLQPYQLLLTGAPNEHAVNAEFRQRYWQRWGESPIENLAGAGSLDLLSGIIDSCDLFVSSDSGPYHMSVGLGKPTIVLFHRPNPAHYHRVGNLLVLVAPSVDMLLDALRQRLPAP
ncbi:glycosyltransferase family 9 protein [Candidatus Igneacidithiobacillus taiwanensis]|uniref:glycosyltransferase family 9 protein n=1 Tax=Candidatus Igneacidithiobacillus taiwanensis TaxID=1945924 RepID=UPI0028A2641A|nr:glycosyltransferase family 9 protein [Candidatus Igneacidithiobacillus taiwanensis]